MVECKFCDEEFDSEREMHIHWGEEHEDELNSHQEEEVKKARRKKEEEQEVKRQKRKRIAGYGLAGVLGLMILGLVVPQLLSGSSSQQADFNLDKQPMLGNPNASVTVVEFGDYKCPYCKRFGQQVFPQLKENYIETGKVNFYFINMAFLAPDSTTAAVAGECALNQVKKGNQSMKTFWNYHHAIYDNQGPETRRWATPDRLMSIARKSTEGLDYAQLRTCITNRKTIDEVKMDKRVAQRNGVSSTPTVFVNGEKVKDGSYQGLKAAIEKELNQ
ncbi:MAG: thioredoxin domain-containing protein [Candidatus Nanohaloarchaea archaeon]